MNRIRHALLRLLQMNERTAHPSFCFRSHSLRMTVCGRGRDTNVVPVLSTLLLQNEQHIAWTYLSDHSVGCEPWLRSQIAAMCDNARWKGTLRGADDRRCRHGC